MGAILVALLLAADDAAVRRAVATFNHTWERGTVLTRGAAVPDFGMCWSLGQSQMYFEVTAVRFEPEGRAVVEATGTRYGSLFLRRTSPARFRMRREGGEWKIESLEVSEGCFR